MATYYISTTGNDSTGDGSQGNPYLTLAQAVSVASNGDTIKVETGTYVYAAAQTIAKELTIEAADPANKPRFEITTAVNGFAVTINASNVTLNNLEIAHLGSFSSNDACINLVPGGTAIYPDSGIPVNENVSITNCRLEFSKFAVTSKMKSFTVSGCTIHSRASTTARSIAVYSQNGTVTIDNNTFTSDGNVGIEGVHCNFATNDSYINQRNGTLNVTNNTCTQRTITRRFVFFEVGSNNGLEGDVLNINVENNNVTSTRDILLLMPNTNDFLKTIGRVNVKNNTITTLAGGFVKIDTRYAGAPLGTSWGSIYTTNFPIFDISGNTATNGDSITIGNIGDRLGYEPTSLNTGDGTLPANIADILYPALNPITYVSEGGNNSNTGSNSGAPVLDFPTAVNITEVNGTIVADENFINGVGGSSGNNINLKKLVPTAGVNTESITDFTVRLDTSSNGNGNIIHLMELRPSTRATVNSKPAPFQFTTKFIDTATNQVLTNITHTYEITLPGYANRSYMLVHRENGTETPDFVTNALLKTGETDVYTFTLTTNSTYTLSDPQVFELGAGAGDDPHVKTLYGTKFDLPHATKWWNLLSYENLKIKAHTTGYQSGYYFNEAEVKVNNEVMKIDFNKQKIKASPYFKPVKVAQNESNLAKSKKTMHVFYIDACEGLHLVIDLKTKYIVPIFNRIPEKGKAKGILAEK